MFSSNTIRLFWWNEIKLQGKSKENYGDLLGKYLVEKISNKNVVWSHPSKFSLLNFFKPIFLTVGSILAHANENSIVWGSGIISTKYLVKNAKFLAVRGPQTRKYLVDRGYDVPEIYGDPALLLPRYYSPDLDKKYNFGIIPHYRDFSEVSRIYKDNKEIFIIDLMTNNIEETTNQILSCKRIVSSSLHGIIVAHAYQIPAVWQRFSDKPFGDDIKFQDYFESVKMKPYYPNIVNKIMNKQSLEKLFEEYNNLPDKSQVDHLSKELMNVCPFKA